MKSEGSVDVIGYLLGEKCLVVKEIGNIKILKDKLKTLKNRVNHKQDTVKVCE